MASKTRWQVIWSQKSYKQLLKLDKPTRKIIFNAVNEVTSDPYTATKRLADSRFYQLRVNKYRVILDLQHNTMIIFVVETDKRKRVYKK